MQQHFLLFLVLGIFLLPQTAAASKNCVCLAQPNCKCTDNGSSFPSCDLCNDCEAVFASCTNVVDSTNVHTVGTGSVEPTLNIGTTNRNCVIIDGVTVSGNIQGGGIDCVRLINGAVLDGDIMADYGSDCVEVIDSDVRGEIIGASQEDCVRVNRGVVERTTLGPASDCFVAVDSVLGGDNVNTAVSGDSHSDCIIIMNSEVEGDVRGESQEDCIEVLHSDVEGDLKGDSGNDILYVQKSTLHGKVDADTGDDTIAVLCSTVDGDVDGFVGNDEITVTSSDIDGGVLGGEGADELIVCDNSNIDDGVDGEGGYDVCASDESSLPGCEKELECYSFIPK